MEIKITDQKIKDIIEEYYDCIEAGLCARIRFDTRDGEMWVSYCTESDIVVEDSRKIINVRQKLSEYGYYNKDSFDLDVTVANIKDLIQNHIKATDY